MTDWSGRRKRIIFLIVFLALLVFIAVPGFFLFYEAPACNDGEMNGDETGVDCGGSCQLLCRAESLPIVTKGDPRVVVVATSTAESVYEVVAIFQNPNPSAQVRSASYSIRLYGSDPSGAPLRTIEGRTFVPKNSTFAIFEGPFSIDGEAPARAVFEWEDESLVWQRDVSAKPELNVKSRELSNLDTRPRLTAVLENASLVRVSNIELVALVSDERGNAIAASRTYIEALSPGESAPVIFSWPRPLAGAAVGTEVMVRVFPDRSFIR